MRALPLVVLVGTLALTGCRGTPPEPDVFARVGDAVLTEEDLRYALAAVPAGADTTLARDQFLEQWLTNQLLAQEARRRGLGEREDIRRQLQEHETSVLAAALIEELYERDGGSVNPAELEAYFEQHRDRLRLREPYVRVRFLEVRSATAAERARAALQTLARPGTPERARDSLFVEAARRFAVDPEASLSLAESFVPQSRLTRQAASAPWAVVAQLRTGEVSAVLPTATDTYFVVYLEERVPAGAVPELAWVREDLQRHLLLQSRKRLVAREVQRLRAEAEARGALFLPEG